MKKEIIGLALLIIATSANAEVVTYTLDNVFQDNGAQMTGKYDWTYTEGDFENGIGVFSEIDVPGYGTDLSGLKITIDTKSIEVSLSQNLDSKNVAVSLKFPTLTPTTGSDIDLTLSKWEDLTGSLHLYTMGAVTPTVVEIPSIPTNLTATDGTHATVNTTWSAVIGATYYEVYRSEVSNTMGSMVDSADTNSFIDATVTTDTLYYYRVKACNVGCSDYSTYNSGYIGTISVPPTQYFNPSVIMYLLN